MKAGIGLDATDCKDLACTWWCAHVPVAAVRWAYNAAPVGVANVALFGLQQPSWYALPQ